MKNSIKVIAIASLFLTSSLISCQSSSEEVDNAKEDVRDANEDVKEANEELNIAEQEYMQDVENFRAEITSRIDANNKEVAELKESISNENSKLRSIHEKELAELEAKNEELKQKMDDYKGESKGREKWETFKKEFGYDMDELGKSLKNLGVKNVKKK